MNIDLGEEHATALRALEAAAQAYHEARGALLAIERLIAQVNAAAQPKPTYSESALLDEPRPYEALHGFDVGVG